jgi:hypothetical protein
MKLALALFFCLISSQCIASAPAPSPTTTYDATVSGSSKNDTRVYIGLGWVWGVKTVFESMIGIRSTNVDSSGKVTGSDVSASVPLTGFDSVKVKAKYINGTTNGQGEIGLGYVFGPGRWLGTAGYSLPYFGVGADYIKGRGVEPFANVNTVNRLNKPSPSYSCTGVTATLIGTTCQAVPN